MIDGLVLQNQDFTIEGRIDKSDCKRIEDTLRKITGLATVEVGNAKVAVEFYPDLLSTAAIRSEIETLGYKIESKAKSRNPFKRFVNRLIESNEKTFGNETLDCCKLNNQPHLK